MDERRINGKLWKLIKHTLLNFSAVTRALSTVVSANEEIFGICDDGAFMLKEKSDYSD